MKLTINSLTALAILEAIGESTAADIMRTANKRIPQGSLAHTLNALLDNGLINYKSRTGTYNVTARGSKQRTKALQAFDPKQYAA